MSELNDRYLSQSVASKMVAACELWLCIACMLFLWLSCDWLKGLCNMDLHVAYYQYHVVQYAQINAYPRTRVLLRISLLLRKLLQPVNFDGQFGQKNM